MEKSRATSVSIHVYENEIHFRFFDDVWDDSDRLMHEQEVSRIVIPRSSHNEVAIYTGDDNEAYDYTDWFTARKPLPEGFESLYHETRA